MMQTPKGGFAKEGTNFAKRSFEEFSSEEAKNTFCQGFTGFQDHISCKAIGNNHVDRPRKEVMPFCITVKVGSKLFEQRMGAEGEIVSFKLLASIGKQTHGWGFFSYDLAAVSKGHNGVVLDLSGSGIRVSAGVAEDEVSAAFRWHVGSDRGSFDSGEHAQFDGGGGDCGASVARTHHGCGCAIF